MTRRSLTSALAIGVALTLAGCGGSSASSTPDTGSATTTAAPAGSSAAAIPTTCEAVTPTTPPTPKTYTAAPTAPIPTAGAKVVMVTSCGRITFVLDATLGGVVADSVAGLVADHFYDGLTFHRVIKGFVLQGGDPKGDGSGGPGYTVVQAPPTGYAYKLGDLAMAKTATEPDGTSGSQFFVISGPDGEALPPQYAIVGHSSDAESLATIARIDALGGSGDVQTPSQTVTIVSATLTK